MRKAQAKSVLEHNEYSVRKEGNRDYMACGCVWIDHVCTMENMCAEGLRIAKGVRQAVYGTPEGRARIAELRRENGLLG